MHSQMYLHPPSFEQVKAGTKTIESRLYDEKRKELKVGDTIEFLKRPDGQEKVSAEIINLVQASTFDELYNKFPLEEFGENSREDLKKYYTSEDEKKYSVVGIQIKLLHSQE